MRVNFKRAAMLMTVSCTALGMVACGTMQAVKSFSTPYQAPDSGDRARLRVVSFDGMVRAVPRSNCVDWRLPGAGVMVSSTKGFANLNDQKLGMPPGSMPDMQSANRVVAVSELYIPAGEPFVIHYLSQGTGQHQCAVSRTFVPAAGEDYEATFTQVGQMCRFGVNRLAKGGVAERPTPVELAPAPLCQAGDKL